MSEQLRLRIKEADAAEPEIIRMKLLETGWGQKRLYSGDYWFHTHDFRKVGITRKRVEDLLASLSGRKNSEGKREYLLPKQLENMIEEYHILIFLLEGSWRMVSPNQRLVSNRGVEYHTWSMVWNFLRRWQDKGFTLELTVNEGHTIQRLNELFALYQKPYSLSGNTKAYTDDRLLSLPSGLRGKAGQKLLESRSLREIANMSAKDVLRAGIDGIGQKRAMLIEQHFTIVKGDNE